MNNLPTKFAPLFSWLPRFCLICHAVSKDLNLDLCGHCLHHLPWWPAASPKCSASPLGAGVQACVPIFKYQAPIKQLMHRFKDQHELAVGACFAELLRRRLQAHYATARLPELVLPVPLAPARLRWRGYNQVMELLPWIRGAPNWPPLAAELVKRRATKSQRTLPRHLRQRNVQGAFYLQAPLSQQYVAIVDDVVTTGHTVRAMAQCLRGGGATQIDIWCIARVT